MSRAAGRSAGEILGLAASPCFAAMAVLALLPGHSRLAALCGAVPASHPGATMAVMYALMALFHAGAWLRPRER